MPVGTSEVCRRWGRIERNSSICLPIRTSAPRLRLENALIVYGDQLNQRRWIRGCISAGTSPLANMGRKPKCSSRRRSWDSRSENSSCEDNARQKLAAIVDINLVNVVRKIREAVCPLKQACCDLDSLEGQYRDRDPGGRRQCGKTRSTRSLKCPLLSLSKKILQSAGGGDRA